MSLVGRGSTSNNYVIATNSSLNFPNADWCFWCWVFLTNWSGTSEEDVWTTNGAQTAGNAGVMWRLMQNTGATSPGKARLTYRDDAAVNATRASVNDIPLYQPVLLFFQRTGSNNQLWMGVRGQLPVLEVQSSNGSLGTITSAVDWKVGCRAGASATAALRAGNEVWGCGKADVALLPEEIAYLATGASPLWLGRSLVVYLPFNNGPESTVFDISGTANHGTRNGNFDTGFADVLPYAEVMPVKRRSLLGATQPPAGGQILAPARYDGLGGFRRGV